MHTPPAQPSSDACATWTWTSTAAIAREAHACAARDPARSQALVDGVLSWCIDRLSTLAPFDAWEMLCALPVDVLATAIDSPDTPAGLLLAHARPSLHRAPPLHPDHHLLSPDHVARLEQVGMAYDRVDVALLRRLWVSTGSARAEKILNDKETAADHVAVWWRAQGLVAPDTGFHPHVARIAARALSYRLPMSHIPIFRTFLQVALESTQVFDPRVLVPAFALEAPPQCGFGRAEATTALLLEGLPQKALSPVWRAFFLAVSPDTKSAHHLLARRVLLDRLPPFEAMLSMPSIPSTPEAFFALRRDLDATATGRTSLAAQGAVAYA